MASSGNTWQKKLMAKARRNYLTSKGVRPRHALDKAPPAVNKSREFLAPVKSSYVAPKPRGRSHVEMGIAARAVLAIKAQKRAEFFASLKG